MMKRIGVVVISAIFLLSIAVFGSALNQTLSQPHIGVGGVFYAQASDSALLWLASRVDLFVQGRNPRSRNPNAIWAGYLDHVFQYAYEAYLVDAYAAANGYDPEDFYTHMNVDYTHKKAWNRMDQFDRWEANSSGGNINGVFLFNGSTYTDKTAAAYDATVGDVAFSASNTQLYLGYGRPFDQANFVVSTARMGGAVAFEYWNGTTWADLAATDGTRQLSVSGRLYFVPPTDWAKTVVNGSRPKWWIRARISSAPSTYPVLTSIRGDNWMTGSLSRGWPAVGTDRVICCSGAFLYERGTPPAGATARFRYQSRVRGFFGSTATIDDFYFNHSVVQDGRLVSKYLTKRVLDLVAANGFNAVMFDDVNSTLSSSHITSPPDWLSGGHIDWVVPPDYTTQLGASYGETAAALHAASPAFKVGANCAACPDSFPVLNGDWVLVEDFNHTTPGDMNWNRATSARMVPDDFHPAYNTNNTVAVLVTHDDADPDRFNPSTGVYANWEKGNRRPIAALAFFYIAANPNLYFYYRPLSINSGYSDTDEIYYYSDAVARLTTQIDFKNDATAKDIYATGPEADFTSFPSSGTLWFATTGETVAYTKIDNTHLRTSEPIYAGGAGGSHLVGTEMRYVAAGHLGSMAIPALNRIFRWSNYFPAMGVNTGVPDISGWNGGARSVTESSLPLKADGTPGVAGPWKTQADCGAPGQGIWRRDYTNAVVLLRPAYWATTAEQYNTPCPSGPFDLGASYYPLNADGTTGTGLTAVNLRAGEGAILLKSPGTAQSLTITTASLASGAVGVGYSESLAATGGTPPYSWDLANGSLPAGLSLSSDGVLSGTPTVGGTSTFTVRATDAGAATATAVLSIQIINNPTIITATLPRGLVGVEYSAILEATGDPPLVWSLVSGSLPEGLSLSSEGVISGTPSVAGTSNFTVQVSNGATDTKAVELTVQENDSPLSTPVV